MLFRTILLGVTILIGVALLVLLILGWRARVRRQRGVAALNAVPELAAGAREFGGKYVATTAAGDPYDRIAVGGLGFRGLATVGIHPEGLLVRRTGEVAVWIPKADLIGIDRATWTIDRVVERDGLHLVRWRLGDREVDTYLRLDEPREFDAAAAALTEARA
jgi:hypothetical protein